MILSYVYKFSSSFGKFHLSEMDNFDSKVLEWRIPPLPVSLNYSSTVVLEE